MINNKADAINDIIRRIMLDFDGNIKKVGRNISKPGIVLKRKVIMDGGCLELIQKREILGIYKIKLLHRVIIAEGHGDQRDGGQQKRDARNGSILLQIIRDIRNIN